MMKLNKHWKAHCNLLLSASGLVLISIAGCGGGGGGSKKVAAPTVGPTNIPSGEGQPTPTPTTAPTPGPTPDLGPSGACPIDPNSYQPNYAAPLLAGFTDPATGDVQPPNNLLRHAGYPLKVYFTPNTDLTPARQTYAITGFTQWDTATQGRVNFTTTTDKTQADIVITFSPYEASDNGILGLTTLKWDMATNILFEFRQDTTTTVDGDRAGHILLNYTGNQRTDVTTAAHEFGHALGIGGHSPNNLDQMYFADNPNNSGLVTTSDVNTLRVAACDNFTPLAKVLKARTMRGARVRTLVIADTAKEIGVHLPTPKK